MSAQEILNREMQMAINELNGQLRQVRQTVEILEKRLDVLEDSGMGGQSSS